MWKLTDALYGVHGEWFKFCLDLNGTQISAHQSLLYSIGCNIIGLNSYIMPGNTHGVEDWKPEEWETLLDMADVVTCSNLLTTQAQYETVFTGVLGPLIQHNLTNSLFYNSLSVIETAKVTKIQLCRSERNQCLSLVILERRL